MTHTACRQRVTTTVLHRHGSHQEETFGSLRRQPQQKASNKPTGHHDVLFDKFCWLRRKIIFIKLIVSDFNTYHNFLGTRTLKLWRRLQGEAMCLKPYKNRWHQWSAHWLSAVFNSIKYSEPFKSQNTEELLQQFHANITLVSIKTRQMFYKLLWQKKAWAPPWLQLQSHHKSF